MCSTHATPFIVVVAFGFGAPLFPMERQGQELDLGSTSTHATGGVESFVSTQRASQPRRVRGQQSRARAARSPRPEAEGEYTGHVKDGKGMGRCVRVHGWEPLPGRLEGRPEVWPRHAQLCVHTSLRASGRMGGCMGWACTRGRLATNTSVRCTTGVSTASGRTRGEPTANMLGSEGRADAWEWRKTDPRCACLSPSRGTHEASLARTRERVALPAAARPSSQLPI